MTRLPFTSLITLAAAVFLSATIQMLPMGLLTNMSTELDVSASLIGLTVSFWALSVVLTSTALTRLTRRVDRRSLVAGLLVVLALVTLVSGLAPNFSVFVVARIFGGMAHGVFWATIGAYPAYIVPREQIGRGVSVVFSGGSLAFLVGLPVGAALGQAAGWRTAFLLLAALALAGSVLMVRTLPSVRPPRAASAVVVSPPEMGISAPPDQSVARHRPESLHSVVFICLVTAAALIGQYSMYTYIEPFLVREMGIEQLSVGLSLAAFGAAGVVALVMVSLWFSRVPHVGLFIALSGSIIAALLLGGSPTIPWIAYPAFLLWGLTMGMLPTLLQTLLLHASSATMRDTSSAFFTTAYNIGVGGGAMLGGLALESWGLGSLPVAFAGFTTLAILLALIGAAQSRGGPNRLRHYL